MYCAKPAPETPFTALAMVDLAVWQVCLKAYSALLQRCIQIGEAIFSSDGTRISFTGSTL
jgi:succinate-semialdehyde dehydrogenase/glutarate-semialdehyde dehydrogenase